MISIYEGPYTRVLDKKLVIIGDNILNKNSLNEKYKDRPLLGNKNYNSKDNTYIDKEELFNKLTLIKNKGDK